METVSKFSLNPLATCFVPSSMKNLSMMSAVFSIPNYETSVNRPIGVNNGSLSIVTNKQNTATDYFGTRKEHSSLFEEETKDPFIIEEVKETLLGSTEEEVATKEPFSAAKIVHSTEREVTEEITERLNGEGISEQFSKGRISSRNTSLTKLDITLPSQPIMGKIAKFLKGGTKTLWMLLPFAIRSLLVVEFFYRMGLRTISLNLTVTSNLYSILKPNFNAITYPKNSKKTKITRSKAKRNECHCPPMFGWIVPLEFFGNPLKLPKTCEKEYVHASYIAGSSEQPQKFEHLGLDESSNFKDEAITLEQCSSELKAVIKDVCDSLSSHDQDSEEADPSQVSETRKRPVWENETNTKVEKNHLALDIIDDGYHPLLREIHLVDTEDIEITSIQTFLGEAFSFPKKASGQEILSSQSVCNPPCSIWCNKVPPPAKDAYRRFIKKIDSESTVHQVTDVKRRVLKKPLYKRCFSADDTPKSSYYDKMPLLSASSFESRERLLLLRKDPVAFIKQSSTVASKDTSHISRSKVSVISQRIASKSDSNESRSDKWCLYDGADSMWQPLPECIPSSDNAQRQSHRKARDMRRQKSVC